MKDFHFDLIAQAPGLQWKRLTLLALGIVALGTVVAYQQTVLGPKLKQQRELVQEQMATLGKAPPPSSMSAKELAQAWQRARSASVQLGLPWQDFFVQLGSAARTGNVAFISIEPDSQKGFVVLVAEARTLESMLLFLKDLQGSPEFSEVVLQSHIINKNVPEKPVRFRISATWRNAL